MCVCVCVYDPKRHMYPSVQTSIIYNTQDMEAT